MPKLEEQFNEQVLKGTVSVNDQNLQQALIETAVLDDLNDVAISSPTNGQILGYNSGTNSWQNTNVAIVDGASIINSTLENNTVTTGTYSSPVNEALLIKARKASAGTITKGQVVYIVGSTGNHLTVELAQADAEATSAYTIGIAATTITNTADGYVMQNGRLTGLSTLPTASFTDGDALYLSEITAGGYRVGIPTAPNHGVFLGFVVRASNGNVGEIDVRIDNYQELEELSDVNITGVAANNFLVRNATNTRWENATTSSVKTTLAINNVDNTSDANKPVSTATQTALDNLELKTKIRNAGLINGFIRVTVASNNLTVAISTSPTSQVDPTATNPVYVFIDGVLRSITGALSLTRNAGTNWFNSGSAELATKEIDYFVYMGYNATDGVTLGFARIPYARLYSDFNTTTTNEKHCAISTITNAAAGDNYIVVGRFAATLSAGAGYTWSVPTFNNANLIQEPIYETRILSFTPAYSAGGSMTYTSVTTTIAVYQIINTEMIISVNGSGTTGGTASNELRCTVPMTKTGSFNEAGNMITKDSTGGANVSGWGYFSNLGLAHCLKIDSSNYGLGSGRVITFKRSAGI